jgi:type III secretion system YscD/HrpQ family protein
MADHGDWILKIISGPHQGVEEMLPEGRLLVGTDPDCSIVLHDVLIAPQHFALTRKGGSVIVEALGGRTYCGGKRVTVPTAVPAFSFVTAGTTHVVVGPAAGNWPLLSSADAPELEKEPPLAPATPAAAPAGSAPATLSPTASVAPAAPTTPTAPTPEQRRRAWWMVGFGGTLLAVWLILWLLLRPAPSEPIRPSPKARTERVLGSLPGGNRIRIEERGDLLVISGYLDSDAAHRDLIAALRAEVPEATLRLWSTPRLVETARAFLATRKLNLTLTPGENGELKIAGTAPSDSEWEVARQMLLAEVPGLQNIIEEVTAPKERVKGSKASTEPAAAPDKALTVIALQTLPEAPAWVRLANGAVYFAGGRFQGIATFTGLEGAQARFEHDGGAALFGLGDDLAVLLPAGPAEGGPSRLEPASRRAALPPPVVATAPTPTPAPAQPAPTTTLAPGLSDTKPVEPTPTPVAATRPVPPEATSSPAPPAPVRPAPAATPTPDTTVAATPTPASVVPANEAATPAATVPAEPAPARTPAPAQTVASSPAPATPPAVPAAMPSEAESFEPAPITVAAPAPPPEAPTPVATAQADASAAPTPASPAPVATVVATPTPTPAAPATEAATSAAVVSPEPIPAPALAPAQPVASSPAPAAEAPVAAAPEPLPPLPAEYVKNPTEAKIRLISDALQARDVGDLAAAQRALSLLAQLLPNDGAVLRLRTDIEAHVLAQQQVRPTPAL